jgi:beta-lactamase regulating signal transducer with metallopeptidase domain
MNYLWNAVSSHGNSFDLLLFLAASAMKATLLLGFVALLCLFIRRFSAATRHLLWTLSLCAALLLPFLSVIEVWEVPVLPAQISAWSPARPDEFAGATGDALQLPEKEMPQSTAVPPELNESAPKISDFQPAANAVENPLPLANTAGADAHPEQSSSAFLSKLVNWALAVWFAGALLLFLRLLIGFTTTNWLTRSAVEFKDPKLTELFSSLLTELRVKGGVRLLRSERTLMPIVCGVLRPAVLLPASADDWSEERRRMVLLHELTHVRRKDCLTQLLGQAACAFYWFNPFVWHAARRLRVERERACDDYVLRIGTKPSDYAHHLLEIARYLQGHSVFQWSQTTTVAMARPSQLEGRLLAILSKEGKRRAMSQLMTAGVTALVFLLSLSLAVVRPTVSGTQNSQFSEIGLGEETGDSEKSTTGSPRMTLSELRGKATTQGAKPEESSVTQGGNADLNADDDSREKILNGAQVDHAARQQLQADPVSAIENQAAETPPRLEDFPAPVAAPGPALPVHPFIKVTYQQEQRTEAQGKSGDFIDEMASVGYVNLSVKELVSLKVSGVTADYVRSLRALGLGNLAAKEVAGMKVNNVSPAFIQSIRNAGYAELTVKELTSFRIHGVTPDFIGRLRSAGYGNLSARQLIDFAVHRVTPEFIGGMRAVGFGSLSPKDLVSLRVFNVTPEFVRAARNRLGDLTVKQIIALKSAGLLDKEGGE